VSLSICCLVSPMGCFMGECRQRFADYSQGGLPALSCGYLDGTFSEHQGKFAVRVSVGHKVVPPEFAKVRYGAFAVCDGRISAAVGLDYVGHTVSCVILTDGNLAEWAHWATISSSVSTMQVLSSMRSLSALTTRQRSSSSWWAIVI